MAERDLEPAATGDDRDDAGERPGNARRALMLALAVVLGTGAFFWASSVLAFVYLSLPDNPDGPMFSVAGAALQSLVGIGGALALVVVAIAIGDRATGGDRTAWHPALTLTAGTCLAGWLLLIVTSP
ncbi:MAG: hypothetical protein LT070_00010 [Solirubrobacteraceae bacterium]|nr:hypothetical protein [Solirubrobacteraceae bacterium]